MLLRLGVGGTALSGILLVMSLATNFVAQVIQVTLLVAAVVYVTSKCLFMVKYIFTLSLLFDDRLGLRSSLGRSRPGSLRVATFCGGVDLDLGTSAIPVIVRKGEGCIFLRC